MTPHDAVLHEAVLLDVVLVTNHALGELAVANELGAATNHYRHEFSSQSIQVSGPSVVS